MKASFVLLLVSLLIATAVYETKLSSGSDRPSSVMIAAGPATGSGVCVVRGDTTYVWTAGHVIVHVQHAGEVIDPTTGVSTIAIAYEEVTVGGDLEEGGRKVGSESFLAEVIRFSDAERGGEDLALLRVRKKNFVREGVSFIADDELPETGLQCFHIGSMNGRAAPNSFTQGVVSTLGRLRSGSYPSDTICPKLYDQISLTALPGCSGGGVFRSSDRKCLGLFTQGVASGAEGANLIVPARRIREFAKRTHCLWAVDPGVPVPEVDDEVVTDRPIPIPK
jgi:S1-C subfamily serine protease